MRRELEAACDSVRHVPASFDWKILWQSSSEDGLGSTQSKAYENEPAVRTSGQACVQFVETLQPRPVYLLDRRHAQISTAQATGIAFYAGISITDYFRTCHLVAITQLKALAENQMLEPEDLECQSEPLCLFTWLSGFESYASVFERRQLCPGCLRFYLATCAEREVLLLRNLLDRIG